MPRRTKRSRFSRPKNAKRSKETKPTIANESESEEPDLKRVRWGKSQHGNETTEGKEQSSVSRDFDTSSEEETDGNEKRTCMAIVSQFKRVAAAYYDPTKRILYLLEDTPESDHYDFIRMIVDQVQPDLILTSSSSDGRLSDMLEAEMDGNGGVFVVRPRVEFGAKRGRERLLGLRLLAELVVDTRDAPSDVASLDGESHLFNAYEFMQRSRGAQIDPLQARWNAFVRLGNFASLEMAPLCLACVAALLDHLVREQATHGDEGVEGLDMCSIEAFPLSNAMHINNDSLLSLQIFDTESHAATQSSQTKEGLSLFGILNNTRTAAGRVLMRDWFVRPSLSIQVIEGRHDAISCFLRGESLGTANAMHSHIKGIGSISRAWHFMKQGTARARDLQAFVRFVYHAMLLRESCSELSGGHSIQAVKKLIAALDAINLKDLGTIVNETVDWEESETSGRVCVRHNIDKELDQWKHTYHGLEGVLSEVSKVVSQQIPQDYSSCLNVVYFPQLGFLICVPLKDEWRGEEGIQLLEGWSFQFSSEENVYAKSPETRDLDLHIGDLLPHIVDREIEVIQSMLEKIVVHDRIILNIVDVCAEIDCLLSFAEASRAYKYVRPTMTLDNTLDIKGGRHPLQEQVVDTFVPNDAFIGYSLNSEEDNIPTTDSEDGHPRNSILICTGANACGKSVYMKQIALIQYMAQIGCFVPADSATLGLIDKMFTRVQTRESVSKIQSAFMIDLNQVSLAIRNATPRSLVILDEFGKGTLNSDGAGLLAAIVKYFVSIGPDCPKILLATHFHELFQQNLLPPELPITLVHMEILMTDLQGSVIHTDDPGDGNGESQRTRDDIGEPITYLYKVASRPYLHSHAAKCALLFGVPRSVVNRALHVSDLAGRLELGQLLDETLTEKQATELEECESVCRRFLDWNLESDRDDCMERLITVLG
ncbi:hypothetical protein SISSUDRAFT_1114147 [Sistotremastrum suecicum HHB10207 ss-3]|uniref:DNA mismatch repair proteins mutS family domain-containing protein n=1 Tax=Sistotremastrum suecicum HHB10207 ss-3 TaxID=1314776 RepID=A0A166CUS4_9AGAM|nr:hypothetical protein SISSUDRAFT_1114147 [Sistotremastrum suecicum HHB10207 ss-3]